MNIAKQAAKALEEVHAFNERFPVGTEVRLFRDNGDTVFTKVRYPAQVSSSGHAVVWLIGISGYYLCDRVTAISEVNS